MVFNFDEWALLAKQDRLAFEQKRADTLQQYITTRARTQTDLRKLRGLQFKVDMLRRKHKTPLAACIAISELLMEHAYQLANPDLAVEIHNAHQLRLSSTSNIVPFPDLKK